MNFRYVSLILLFNTFFNFCAEKENPKCFLTFTDKSEIVQDKNTGILYINNVEITPGFINTANQLIKITDDEERPKYEIPISFFDKKNKGDIVKITLENGGILICTLEDIGQTYASKLDKELKKFYDNNARLEAVNNFDNTIKIVSKL